MEFLNEEMRVFFIFLLFFFSEKEASFLRLVVAGMNVTWTLLHVCNLDSQTLNNRTRICDRCLTCSAEHSPAKQLFELTVECGLCTDSYSIIQVVSALHCQHDLP